jgi:hypothetical protein
VDGTRKATKGGTVDEERERVKPASEESEVEAHRKVPRSEGSEAPESELDRRETDDDSDVEAHRFKA